MVNNKITIIILGLIAGMVIGFISYNVIKTWTEPFNPPVNFEMLRNEACNILLRTPNGCENVSADSVSVNFDTNKDGKIDEKDTLESMCINYFESPGCHCKELCGCNVHCSICGDSNGTAPLVTVEPMSQSGKAGSTLYYKVTMTNMDDPKSCIATDFSTEVGSIVDWKVTGQGDFTLKPKESANFTLGYKSSYEAKTGSYTLSVRVEKRDNWNVFSSSRTLYFTYFVNETSIAPPCGKLSQTCCTGNKCDSGLICSRDLCVENPPDLCKGMEDNWHVAKGGIECNIGYTCCSEVCVYTGSSACPK